MAEFVSVSTLSVRPRKNGQLYVRARYTLRDNNGVESFHHCGPKTIPIGWDLHSYAPRLLARLARAEEFLARDMENVTNPLEYAQNARWSTFNKIAQSLIHWMRTEKNPRIVFYLEPLLDHIKANFSLTQIANALKITESEVLSMNRRIKKVLTESDTMRALLIEFDAEEIA